MYTQAQFNRDSEIITKMLYIETALLHQNGMMKQAGVVTDHLKSLVQSIVEDVRDRFKREGTVGALSTYIVNGLLPGKFKWLAILVDYFFGVSAGTIVNMALTKAKEIMDKNGSLTMADVSRIVGGGNSKTASLDYFYELEKKGEITSTLVKEARGREDMLQQMIKSLSPAKGKSLVGGLVRWFITAILMGLVGVAATEGPKAVVKEVAGDPSQSGPASSASKSQGYSLPAKATHNLKPSGQGEQFHNNTGNTIWVVKLNGSLENTLMQWITMIYPELKGKESQIRNSPSFNTMVSRLKLAYNPAYPGYLQILPDSDLHTWRDIADRSIGDVV